MYSEQCVFVANTGAICNSAENSDDKHPSVYKQLLMAESTQVCFLASKNGQKKTIPLVTAQPEIKETVCLR